VGADEVISFGSSVNNLKIKVKVMLNGLEQALETLRHPRY